MNGFNQVRRIHVRPIILLPVLLLATVSGLPAQVPVEDFGTIGTDVELEDVSALLFGVTSHAIVHVDGEIFEFMSGGYGGGPTAGAQFGRSHIVRASLSIASYGDDISKSRAETVDLSLAALWLWRVREACVEAGPTLGYAWLLRDLHSEAVGGLVAGGEISV